MVHLEKREPRRRPMTVLAEIGAQNVVDRFGGGSNPITDRMAGSAVCRCPLKNRARMTRFARGNDVSTIQREPCREVIEIRCKARLR